MRRSISRLALRKLNIRQFTLLACIVMSIGIVLFVVPQRPQAGFAKQEPSNEVFPGVMAGVNPQRTRSYDIPAVIQPKSVRWKTSRLFTFGGSNPLTLMPEGIPGMSSQTIWTRSEYGFTEPVMIDATIYFSLYNSEGYVFAQHSLSGADKWRYKLPGVIFSPVAVAGGAVLAGASDGTLLAISAITGQLIWSKAQKGHEFHTAAPLVANGVVYFSSTEYSAQESVRPKGRVFALELGTGKQLWVYQNRAVVGAAAFADQTLFVGDSEGNLHAIDISTGQERWKFKSSGGAVLQPAIKNGVVYFPAHDGSLHAVDALSGQERWKNTKEPKVATALVLDESDIYFGGERLNLYAVDGSSGQLKWVYKTKDQCHRPVLAAGTVCFTTGNVMQALDTKTGAEKWKVVELSKTVSAPILASDSIYFLDVEGHLYALK